ncbi:DUF2795 domain-containing protein [Nocardiopsis tropica]|uniref:DUF2795 domain-containing protein n=1 Tax=Nocardiopsis tropica TaxID=109330 RepID=UPI0031DD3357
MHQRVRPRPAPSGARRGRTLSLSGGTDMGVKRGISGLRQILDRMEFPADKDRIVARALDEGGDEEILSALRAMPSADFYEAGEVLRAVPLPETERARTESARARERGERP